ncbi:MAG: hypothetical protein HYZ81_04905, partial [Nitrospinae bacterium]|nr:hypothetical protein [Nitrospinota bacterium]
MREGARLRVGTYLLLLAMAVGVWGIGIGRGEAAKPYAATTVKVVVNAEYVKYAMSLV